jgi:hypothetical protein
MTVRERFRDHEDIQRPDVTLSSARSALRSCARGKNFARPRVYNTGRK